MKIFNLKSAIFNLFRVLNPQPPIGGLEINESALNFALIKDGELISASLSLPPGVIEEGKVKNAEAFSAALKELHSKITPRVKKKVYVVATIPEGNLYVQVFNLPMIASNSLEEAVKLNLQMISPVEFQTVYSDWQKIGEVDVDGGQLEILGAFASKQMVDELTKYLIEANFVVAAMEIPGLALGRLINPQEVANKLQSVILLRLSSSGLSFSILRNGNLYFDHFVPWQAGKISLTALEDMIVREAQKVLNFYASHWPSALSGFLLAVPTPEIEEKLSKLLADTFTLQVYPLKNFIDGQAQRLNLALKGSSLVALGSAIRGLIPRSEDKIISATSVGTEDNYRQNQIVNFISVWRNIALTVVLFALVLFGTTEGFLMQQVKSLEARLDSVSILSENQEFNKLYGEVKEFNQRVELALEAKSQGNDWAPFLEKLRDLAGKEIVLRRIFVQSLQTPVLINAQAPSEDKIIYFKNALASEPQFQDVSLPLGNIVPGNQGMIDFSISFKIKSLSIK